MRRALELCVALYARQTLKQTLSNTQCVLLEKDGRWAASHPCSEDGPKERGRRRFAELKEKKQVANTDLPAIIKQVVQRDNEDRNRKIAPLKQAEDAILIDTTHLSVDQVVKEIIKTINPAPEFF